MKKDQNTLPQIEENIVWKRTKIVLKFWWRHFLVSFIVPFFVVAIIRMDISVIMACVLAIMFFSVFDNLKCNYKNMHFSHDDHRSSREEDFEPFNKRYYWNKDVVGTPAYLMNISVESAKNRYH